MQCPVCQTALTMTERQGVEIDYCPRCRGVWLDRGELDKIIERATAVPSVGRRDYHAPRYWHDDDHDDDHKYYRKRKRRSFLSDLFDF